MQNEEKQKSALCDALGIDLIDYKSAYKRVLERFGTCDQNDHSLFTDAELIRFIDCYVNATDTIKIAVAFKMGLVLSLYYDK